MHQHRYGGIRASKPVLVHTNGNVSFFWTAKSDSAFCMHQHRYGASRASKPVLVQVLWHHGQRTCVGAHGIQSRFWGDGKNEILDPRADSK